MQQVICCYIMWICLSLLINVFHIYTKLIMLALKLYTGIAMKIQQKKELFRVRIELMTSAIPV